MTDLLKIWDYSEVSKFVRSASQTAVRKPFSQWPYTRQSSKKNCLALNIAKEKMKGRESHEASYQIGLSSFTAISRSQNIEESTHNADSDLQGKNIFKPNASIGQKNIYKKKNVLKQK